jgi:hypothetical protein
MRYRPDIEIISATLAWIETSTALWYEDDITSGPYQAGGGVRLILPTTHVGVWGWYCFRSYQSSWLFDNTSTRTPYQFIYQGCIAWYRPNTGMDPQEKETQQIDSATTGWWVLKNAYSISNVWRIAVCNWLEYFTKTTWVRRLNIVHSSSQQPHRQRFEDTHGCHKSFSNCIKSRLCLHHTNTRNGVLYLTWSSLSFTIHKNYAQSKTESILCARWVASTVVPC